MSGSLTGSPYSTKGPPLDTPVSGPGAFAGVVQGSTPQRLHGTGRLAVRLGGQGLLDGPLWPDSLPLSACACH